VVGHGGHDTGVNEAVLLSVVFVDGDPGFEKTPPNGCRLNSTVLDKPAAVVAGQKSSPLFRNLFHKPLIFLRLSVAP
jgi:hypothetical protein